MIESNKTILVVDDDAKILRAISLRLTSAGYRVFTACNGNEGLTIAQGHKPDLIITDIWMPVGVGISLAYRLRQTAPEIPIIFLTASKQAKLKDMVNEVGAAGFLEKPYEPEVLLATITKVLNATAQVEPATAVDDSTARLK